MILKKRISILHQALPCGMKLLFLSSFVFHKNSLEVKRRFCTRGTSSVSRSCPVVLRRQHLPCAGPAGRWTGRDRPRRGGGGRWRAHSRSIANAAQGLARRCRGSGQRGRLSKACPSGALSTDLWELSSEQGGAGPARERRGRWPSGGPEQEQPCEMG